MTEENTTLFTGGPRAGGSDGFRPPGRVHLAVRGDPFDRCEDCDRALYRPRAWTDDPARMAAAHVPPGTAFATKPRLALGMIERAIAADVPFAWVAADSIYGVSEIEGALRRQAKGYVLG